MRVYKFQPPPDFEPCDILLLLACFLSLFALWLIAANLLLLRVIP